MSFGHRFIPVMRSAGVEEGLAARLADPLWMLARQWQFGEFRGDDAGSAVSVELVGVAHHPTWWRPEADGDDPDAAPWQPWTVATGPLEALVEAEPADGTARRRLRLDGGVRARRALVVAGLGRLGAAVAARAPWPTTDRDGVAGIDLATMAAAADGEALGAIVEPWSAPGTDVPTEVISAFGLTAQEVAGFAEAMREWFAWWSARSNVVPAGPGGGPGAELDDRQPNDPPAWDPHRLEHRGTLAFAATPDLRLRVDQHPGGRVDWYTVDAVVADPGDLAGAPPPPEALAVGVPVRTLTVPLPATFAGMPAPRFWEFEDARVDYGSVDASPADLARLLLVQFTTVYGNDWFVVPVRMPVGGLVRVDTVRITDSFGEVHDLEPFAGRSAGWRVFSLSAPDDRPELATRWYWSAPALPSSLESPPLERITVRRDEMANTAWAVVERLADRFGRTRHVAVDVPQLPPPTEPARYLVATPVPDNWYPVVPEQVDVDAVKLTLRALVRRAEGVILEARPGGSILAGEPGRWWIYEEELGRAGLTLDRRVQVGRWHDGTRHRWTSRNAWPGSGEAASGLLWDVLVEPVRRS